jgi:hypothetical protein
MALRSLGGKSGLLLMIRFKGCLTGHAASRRLWRHGGSDIMLASSISLPSTSVQLTSKAACRSPCCVYPENEHPLGPVLCLSLPDAGHLPPADPETGQGATDIMFAKKGQNRTLTVEVKRAEEPACD